MWLISISSILVSWMRAFTWAKYKSHDFFFMATRGRAECIIHMYASGFSYWHDIFYVNLLWFSQPGKLSVCRVIVWWHSSPLTVATSHRADAHAASLKRSRVKL